MVVPEPVETAPDGKQHAVYVDTRTAVKVLNRPDDARCVNERRRIGIKR